jgi:pyruvate formate lyase activating enzyme
MKIKHFQKTTLIDYPGEIACTIFLFGCSFRCGFCHNPELVLKEETEDIPQKEVLDFLEERKKYLDGVCFTGGEPLMSIDTEFLNKIKKLGYKIKIDTNGDFPDKLQEIVNNELVDFISMDIKSVFSKYPEITNSKVDIEKIKKSVEIVHNSRADYEFRTTIIEDFHTKEDFKQMMEALTNIIKGKINKFILQGFKNSGKFVDKNYAKKSNTSGRYLEELKEISEHYVEKIDIRV